jgi:hypothetical protein
MANALATGQEHLASTDDVKRILGDLDRTKLLEIMSLRPTVLDVEEASMWLGGDPDVFGASQRLQRVAGDIVSILTADQEEEPPRAG